jgi:hypothetical protein
VLPLRILIFSTGMPSSGLILLLMVRFRTSGVSRSILSCAIGKGLDVNTGILDPDFLSTGFEYIGDELVSAAISSGVRRSQLNRSSSSASSTGSSVRRGLVESSVSPLRISELLRSSLRRPRLVSLSPVCPVLPGFLLAFARLIPAACSSSLSILASLSRWIQPSGSSSFGRYMFSGMSLSGWC